MRKIITLLTLLLFTGAASFGQAQYHQGPTKALRAPSAQVPTRHSFSGSRGGASCDEQLLLDYNLHNEVVAANSTPPLNFNGSWFNLVDIYTQEITPFANAAHEGAFTYAATRYDSLVFADLQSSTVVGMPRADKTISLDSLGMFIGLWGDTVAANGKMTNDSLVFRIYGITGTTQSALPIKTVVFSGYSGLSQFFTGAGYIGYSQIGINQQFTLGQGFAVRMDYRGKDTSSHCFLSYTYADSCGTITFQGQNFNSPAYPSPFAGSSSWAEIQANGTTSAQNSGFAFDLSAAGVPDNCSFVYTQNWEFLPIITVCSTAVVNPTATVVTSAATNVTAAAATLNGLVTANGNSTTVSFEYGTSISYGQTATGAPSNVTGSTPTAVSANISGLTANTLYHFRAKGVNTGGTTNGNDMTFTTSASGTVCTVDPTVTSGLAPTSANVPCVNQTVSFSQTYTFKVPSSATVGGSSIPISNVTFTGVTNLPTGLTAAFSKTPASYAGGETGCFIVTGTTNDACGQYWMKVNVSINGVLTGEISELAATYGLQGFPRNFLRVVGNGGTCPAVNQSQTTDFTAGSCGLTAAITASAVATNVNCFGGATGSATVTANGGANYTYLWNNGQTNATATGLIAGTYTVTVTSGNSTATATATVTQPASAVSASAIATTTTCGASTGTATVTATGGTAGYNYIWANGQTTMTATGLGAGNQSVTVTDTKGCTVSTSADVTTPNGPSATATASPVNCFGALTGSVDATVTGGTAPISYLWSNGATTVDITNVAAGTYTLTVSDNAGCTFSVAATVAGPSAALSIAGTASNNTGGNNGSVNITVGGGTGTYAYNWSNGQSTQDISGLSAGTFTVTVTDQANCTATATYTVANSVGINDIELVNKFSVFPNPASTSVNVLVSFTETTDTKIELMDLTGKVIMTENTGKTNQLNHVINVTAIPAGIYAIRVSGAKFNVVKQLTIAK